MNLPVARDTICAIATPLGVGGIGVVRLSGPEAIAVANRIFSSRRNERPADALERAASHTVHHGWLIDPSTDEVVDEVLVTAMRAPRTYTREDVVEISGHGGPRVLATILECCLAAGSRLAEPGEFTKRAFLNGRLDLTQAEAVMALIHAESEAARRLALRQLQGDVAGSVRALRESLLGLLADCEAGLDFVEQGVASLPPEQLRARLAPIQEHIAGLLETARTGVWLRDGVQTVIAGRPNVGKSSLFNKLLQKNRAIVTPYPGTTRDLLEETLTIDGFPLRLIDMAGLRNSPDPIEQEGIARAGRTLDDADIVLLVLDGSEPLLDDDRALLGRARADRTILILNKIDLAPAIDQAALADECPNLPMVRLSALHGTGCDELKRAIGRLLTERAGSVSGRAIVSSARHLQALMSAAESLVRARAAAESGLSHEFIAADLNDAVRELGAILGEDGSFTEEMLDHIFKQFCIGK
ncbi:MAG: tRNA uridine-5-carboxymethylaminomethyl(34) synthesis GTPase MnmE [Nitrospirota bacterium]